MYSVVVWQIVIIILRVLCDGVAACYMYGVCFLVFCGRLLYVRIVYCVEVGQRDTGLICVMCGSVAA